MRWSILNNLSVRPALKCGAEAALLDPLMTLISLSATEDIQREQAKEARDWQEKMYLKYQSPQALMKQYKEAGINPYLLGDKTSTGQIPSTSIPQAPQVPSSHIGSDYAQLQQAAAVSANQRSSQFLNVVNGISELAKNFSPQTAEAVSRQFYPQLKSLGFDDAAISQIMQLTIGNMRYSNKVLEIESQWQEKHGFEYRSSQLMKVDQEIDALVGQQGLMSSQADLNRQKIDESSSVIARNLAEALKLNKEGDYYVANTQTANQIRGFLISNMILQNGNLAQAFRDLEIMVGNHAAEAEIKRYIASNPYLQGLNYVMDNVGKVVHVGANFNWSDARGMINSVSTVSHGNVPNMPTVTGFVP